LDKVTTHDKLVDTGEQLDNNLHKL